MLLFTPTKTTSPKVGEVSAITVIEVKPLQESNAELPIDVTKTMKTKNVFLQNIRKKN
jgi:hypothetical protein